MSQTKKRLISKKGKAIDKFIKPNNFFGFWLKLVVGKLLVRPFCGPFPTEQFYPYFPSVIYWRTFRFLNHDSRILDILLSLPAEAEVDERTLLLFECAFRQSLTIVCVSSSFFLLERMNCKRTPSCTLTCENFQRFTIFSTKKTVSPMKTF